LTVKQVKENLSGMVQIITIIAVVGGLFIAWGERNQLIKYNEQSSADCKEELRDQRNNAAKEYAEMTRTLQQMMVKIGKIEKDIEYMRERR